MAIILTDSLKKCPDFSEKTFVNFKTILDYEGNPDVRAAFCTRAMAKTILKMDFPNLKVIQLFSAGYDGINLDLVKEKGISLCNAANVYNIGMAEFVVYAMLMSAKKYHRSIKNHRFRLLRNYHYLTELEGKTVGIMGCGNIGMQIAKRLAAFDMHVIGYDANTAPKQFFEEIYGLDERDSFVSNCDYVVCCLPLMRSTEQMLNKDWFTKMKSNVTFVNVARKNVICDKDLIAFLKSHKDATAVLDMFEKIPNPITNPYRRLTNVLVLPGVTAISKEIDKKLRNLIEENMRRLDSGEPLLNQIV